ncbi:MAG: hypothetical protein JO332_15535, partial [Planctomycetaceae bacterium]|nr:hypothetical protein [Planctomycetaceae bacterium]
MRLRMLTGLALAVLSLWGCTSKDESGAQSRPPSPEALPAVMNRSMQVEELRHAHPEEPAPAPAQADPTPVAKPAPN